MKHSFKLIVLIILLSGCQPLVQQVDQPFDPFKYDPNLEGPAFQEEGYSGETYQEYTHRVEVFLTNRLRPYYESTGRSPYAHGLSLADKVAMSRPQEFLPQCSEGDNPTAILMFHSLGGSVQGLTSIAEQIHEKMPCSWIRIPLLKGYGGLPGDALVIDAQRDWLAPSIRLYHDFLHQPGVDSVSIIGHSMGGLIGMLIVQDTVSNSARKPSQLILTSPAIALPTQYELMLPLAKFIKPFHDYHTVFPKSETPFLSYSLSYNELSQFDYLYHLLDRKTIVDSQISVQAWFTAGDRTIDTQKSANKLCQLYQDSMVHVYRKKDQFVDLDQCDDSHVVMLDITTPNVIELTHRGFNIPKHKPYFDLESLWCEGDSVALHSPDLSCDDFKAIDWHFGSENNAKQKLLYGSFNPYFDSMVEEMMAFLREQQW